MCFCNVYASRDDAPFDVGRMAGCLYQRNLEQRAKKDSYRSRKRKRYRRSDTNPLVGVFSRARSVDSFHSELAYPEVGATTREFNFELHPVG